MIAANGVLFLFLVVSSVVCNIQYVPASILIPTLNGSLYIPSNYSNYNKSNNNTNLKNNTYNRPPYHFANNNSYNRSNHSTPYNGSEDGHLILGSINVYDRLLFNQVCIIDFIILKKSMYVWTLMFNILAVQGFLD